MHLQFVGWMRLALVPLCIGNVLAQGNQRYSAPLSAATQDQIVRAIHSDFGVPADAEITFGAMKASEFIGYDSVPVQVKSGLQINTEDFVISRDRTKLVRYQVVDLNAKDPTSQITMSDSLGWGDPNAPVKIIAFMDLQCPFCAAMHKQFTTSALSRYRNHIWITYKPFPLQSHDMALSFAREAQCSESNLLMSIENI